MEHFFLHSFLSFCFTSFRLSLVIYASFFRHPFPSDLSGAFPLPLVSFTLNFSRDARFFLLCLVFVNADDRESERPEGLFSADISQQGLPPILNFNVFWQFCGRLHRSFHETVFPVSSRSTPLFAKTGSHQDLSRLVTVFRFFQICLKILKISVRLIKIFQNFFRT